jgi:hypothetical protein
LAATVGFPLDGAGGFTASVKAARGVHIGGHRVA